MLSMPSRLGGKAAIRGFSLIEMLIAIVIGLIVVAGAVVLILSINQANSQTIQYTRVNQELRSLADVITNEIKRTRRLHDPISSVSQGSTVNGPVDLVDASAGNCILYGYQDTTINDPSSSADAVNNYRVISFNSSSVKIYSTTDATKWTCANANASGTALNSPQIKITSLTFSCPTGMGTTAAKEVCNEIDLTIQGQLTTGELGDKSGFNSITRSYTQPIYIRSGAVKTS